LTLIDLEFGRDSGGKATSPGYYGGSFMATKQPAVAAIGGNPAFLPPLIGGKRGLSPGWAEYRSYPQLIPAAFCSSFATIAAPSGTASRAGLNHPPRDSLLLFPQP